MSITTVICTARPRNLEAVSRAWILRHFPSLADAPLLMRADDDYRPAWQVKFDLIVSVCGNLPVVMADDDIECMKVIHALAERDKDGPRELDAFVLAPAEWDVLEMAIPEHGDCLLCLDLDGTILSSPPCEGEKFAEWRERLLENGRDWPVVPGAREALEKIT
jgi:hypothetical protein